MTESQPSCSRCGRLLIDQARFCGTCGAPSPKLLREKTEKQLALDLETRMASRSLAIAFAGTIGALVLHALLFRHNGQTTAAEFGVAVLLQLLVGCAAAWPIGLRQALESLQRGARGNDFLLAFPAAALALLCSFLWVRLLAACFDGEGEVHAGELDLWMLMQIVILAPLAEEWICRGIMWKAARRLSSLNTTVFITALLFAFLHFLNGGSFFELPHRFAAGLVLGVLRAYSGSIWPGVLAHFLVNLIAVSMI